MTHADWRCPAPGEPHWRCRIEKRPRSATCGDDRRVLTFRQGQGYAGYRPAHGRGGARGKSLRPVARGSISSSPSPWPRTRAFSPPACARACTCRAALETHRGLTSETTCVPGDRDTQRAARSARRASRPRGCRNHAETRGRREGVGCCRWSSKSGARPSRNARLLLPRWDSAAAQLRPSRRAAANRLCESGAGVNWAFGGAREGPR
jgi:hypothetical protein